LGGIGLGDAAHTYIASEMSKTTLPQHPSAPRRRGFQWRYRLGPTDAATNHPKQVLLFADMISWYT